MTRLVNQLKWERNYSSSKPFYLQISQNQLQFKLCITLIDFKTEHFAFTFMCAVKDLATGVFSTIVCIYFSKQLCSLTQSRLYRSVYSSFLVLRRLSPVKHFLFVPTNRTGIQMPELMYKLEKHGHYF